MATQGDAISDFFYHTVQGYVDLIPPAGETWRMDMMGTEYSAKDARRASYIYTGHYYNGVGISRMSSVGVHSMISEANSSGGTDGDQFNHFLMNDDLFLSMGSTGLTSTSVTFYSGIRVK